MISIAKRVFSVICGLSFCFCSSTMELQLTNEQSSDTHLSRKVTKPEAEDRAFEEQFTKTWAQLGEIMSLYSALADNIETPRGLFASSGLLKLAAMKGLERQVELYNALPDSVKYYALYAGNPELMATYVIPDPRIKSWATVEYLP
jgi:hypothetical protein